MSEAAYPPSLDDLASQPWAEIVEACPERTCTAYGSAFCAKAVHETDTKLKNVWTFFARVTTFAINADPTDESGFAVAINALSEEEVGLIAQLAPSVADLELKARLADIVWMRQRKGHFPFVRMAIAAYLESARRLEDPDNWEEVERRAARALRLAASLGNAELRQPVIDYIKEVIDRCNGEDKSYLSARMMTLLLEQQEGDTVRYAGLAHKLAEAAEQAAEYHKAKDYWDIAAAWHRLAGDEDSAGQVAINAAETFVKEAERRRRQPHAPYLHASGNIAFAIEALRKIPGTQKRVAELHRVLLDYQQRSVSEYARFDSGPIDLTEAAQEARRRVEGKPFGDALLSLAMMLGPTNKAETRRMAEQQAKDFVMKSRFASTRVNALGRTIARQPSLASSSADEVEKALLYDMFELASHRWQLYTQGIIEPARYQVNLDHEPKLRDFAPLVNDNPFVPNGRQVLFARGLHAGMIGDFAVAAHLLIPQVEESIRQLLYHKGAIPSGIDPEGIQREFDLNTTLKDSRFRTALEEMLGEDMVFDLRGLLVEPAGANLRNVMAHGLLDAAEFYAYPVRYFWWLTLRLCCLPLVLPLREADT